jgi:hypothetical protein
MRFDKLMASRLVASLAALAASATWAADPWADAVVSYVQGDGVGNDFVTGDPFNDPLVALGEPTRVTSPDSFPGAVTLVNSPFRSTEIVSIGRGGSLVVRFDEPVVDHPANPFGIDLLVFGNAFFTGNFFADPNATATSITSEGGLVEVSADGVNFFAVPGDADGLFPTNAYADIADPLVSTPGSVLSDFTRPVDPAFNPNGRTYADIVAGYNGSGGGLGVDIAAAGLSSISYVRITNPASAAGVPEIDAFADVAAVPEPAAGMTILSAAVLIAWQTRRRR